MAAKRNFWHLVKKMRASDKKFPYGSDKAIKGPHASDKKFPHGSDIAIKGIHGSDITVKWLPWQ